MNELDYVVRKYIKGDEKSYVAFMNSIYLEPRFNLKLWNWEYGNNPFGYIQTFGVSEDRVVGHMGLICVPMKVGNQTIRGSQAVDLAVSRAFRRKGMFIEIGKRLMQDARDEGIAISYGVPSEPAYRGHVKYGWFYVSEIPVLVKIISRKGFLIFTLEYGCAYAHNFIKRPSFRFIAKFIGLVKNSIKASITRHREYLSDSNNFETHEATSFDEQIDEFWEVTSKQYSILVARNSKYLNWRYVMRPNSGYVIRTVTRQNKIEGYAVLSTESHGSLKGKRGYIVDIFARSEKAIYHLLQSAFDYFVEEKVDLVTCWMLKNQMPFGCLSKRGFINDSFISQKLICRINTNDEGFAELYRRSEKGWFFTIGDSDSV
jgi:GNAT superfamily N-acetyltransferase